jgi:hypothetical protein
MNLDACLGENPIRTAFLAGLVALGAASCGSVSTTPAGSGGSSSTSVWDDANASSGSSAATGGGSGGGGGGGGGIDDDFVLPSSGAKAMVPGEDDGSVGRAWPVPRFSIQGGVVRDRLTELDWTQDAKLFVGTLADAKAYVDAMNAGTAPNFGRADWRLPTWKEFLSLLDRGHQLPSISSDAPFVDIDTSTYYWTSTPEVTAIFLGYGHSDNNDRYDPNHLYNVWAVAGDSPKSAVYSVIASRPGEPGVQWDASRFHDNGDGTVTDGLVRLMWSKSMSEAGKLLPWLDALAHVQAMNNGTAPNHGFTDWRLPTSVELESVVYHSSSSVSLPPGHPFLLPPPDNTNAPTVWSSTSYAVSPVSAFCMVVSLGLHSGGNAKLNSLGVWPVRTLKPSTP